MATAAPVRVAVALDPSSPERAGAITALIEMLRRNPERLRDTLVVVPALDPVTVQSMLERALAGFPPELTSRVTVEPAALYLERGHDIGIGAAGSTAQLMADVVSFASGAATEAGPTPSQLLADLAYLTRPETAANSSTPRVSTLLTEDTVITTTSWGAKVVLDAHDVSLTPDILVQGHYDPVLLRFLDLTLRPGDRCVDVGANIGLFTLRMAELVGPQGSVHAFEPVERARQLCEITLQMNYVVDRCVIDNRAISDTDGDATLHVSNRAKGNSSLFAKTADYRHRFPLDDSAEITVSTVRLDQALPHRYHRLVKVDVEGAEGRALAGMSRLVDDGLVGTIVIELVRATAPEEWPGLVEGLDRLAAAGATFSRLDVSGRRVVEPLPRLLAREPMPHLVIDLRHP